MKGEPLPLRGCRVTPAARPKSSYMLKQPRRRTAHSRGEERMTRRGMTRGDRRPFDDASTRVHIHTPRRSCRADTRDTRLVLFPSSHSRRQIFLEFVSGRLLGPAKGPDPPEASSTSRIPLRSVARRLRSPSLTSWESSLGERERSLPIDRRRIAPYATHDRGSIDRKRRRVFGLSAEIGVPGPN